MKIVLVDGYNVIYQSPSLKLLLSQSVSRAQSELVEMVCTYCSLKGVEGYVVFDAYRRPTSEKKAISPLVKVIYTGEGKTADSFIDNFIARNKSRYELIYVITSDYSQAMTVLDKHILPVSPKNFLKELDYSRKYVKEKFTSPVPFTYYLLSSEDRKKIEEKLKKSRENKG